MLGGRTGAIEKGDGPLLMRKSLSSTTSIAFRERRPQGREDHGYILVFSG